MKRIPLTVAAAMSALIFQTAYGQTSSITEGINSSSNHFETAQGTGTPLGTNLIPSMARYERAGFSLLRSATASTLGGRNLAQGTGTELGNNLIPASGWINTRTSTIRSATGPFGLHGKNMAMGTGTQLGTTKVPARNVEQNALAATTRSGTGTNPVKNLR
ncbi:hypothetical protein [Pedobacter sp. SYSU D00535]|uniref:hypothetical protein n=1 Tax=Pedobacter sp. SYSU D00535 TaxID=2810308 RepID=UPI001A97C663|nr:hypothetical protein [Pedobacter sp. SYSU D00535]